MLLARVRLGAVPLNGRNRPRRSLSASREADVCELHARPRRASKPSCPKLTGVSRFLRQIPSFLQPHTPRAISTLEPARVAIVPTAAVFASSRKYSSDGFSQSNVLYRPVSPLVAGPLR